jgi:hypothetical protein
VGVVVELVSQVQQVPFRGFLIQARDTNTDQPVGYFTLPPAAQAKYLACNNNRQVHETDFFPVVFPHLLLKGVITQQADCCCNC